MEHRSLAIDTQRFEVVSSEEGSLHIDAEDWASALCLAMQLLELEDRVSFLRCRRSGEGAVVATDPGTGHHLVVRAVTLDRVAALAA